MTTMIKAEAIGRIEERPGTHSGLENRQRRRTRLERAHELRDGAGIEVGHLGERRRVHRYAAARGDELGELAAKARLEDGDALALHCGVKPMSFTSLPYFA